LKAQTNIVRLPKIRFKKKEKKYYVVKRN